MKKMYHARGCPHMYSHTRVCQGVHIRTLWTKKRGKHVRHLEFRNATRALRSLVVLCISSNMLIGHIHLQKTLSSHNICHDFQALATEYRFHALTFSQYSTGDGDHSGYMESDSVQVGWSAKVMHACAEWCSMLAIINWMQHINTKLDTWGDISYECNLIQDIQLTLTVIAN